MALTDGSGSVQTEYTYEPFGNVTTAGTSSTNTFGFTGRENDGTGLNFYRARYYDPRLQRFVGDDPLGFDQGPNSHIYVWNEPTRHRDPLGLATLILGGGASLVGVTGVEGSAGIALNPGWGGCAGAGFFGSGGIGAGVNVGADAFIGVVRGGFDSVQGQTANVNLAMGPISISAFFDPRTGSLVGGTVGVGPGAFPVQASGSYAWTGTVGYAPGCDAPPSPPGEPPSPGSSGGPGKAGGISNGKPGKVKGQLSQKKD